jgi:hypothetical protein
MVLGEKEQGPRRDAIMSRDTIMINKDSNRNHLKRNQCIRKASNEICLKAGINKP